MIDQTLAAMTLIVNFARFLSILSANCELESYFAQF